MLTRWAGRWRQHGAWSFECYTQRATRVRQTLLARQRTGWKGRAVGWPLARPRAQCPPRFSRQPRQAEPNQSRPDAAQRFPGRSRSSSALYVLPSDPWACTPPAFAHESSGGPRAAGGVQAEQLSKSVTRSELGEEERGLPGAGWVVQSRPRPRTRQTVPGKGPVSSPIPGAGVAWQTSRAGLELQRPPPSGPPRGQGRL